MIRTHGGDQIGFLDAQGCLPLDFSANISPLGVPEGVKAAICAAAGEVDVYPDPLCRRLCEALALHHAVRRDVLLCGNGAADLLWRLALAERPKRALVPTPCFSEYEAALLQVDCIVEHYPLQEENGFALDAGFLERIHGEIDLVILCEPNNPTGRCSNQVLLWRILEACAAHKIRVLVDECFCDFLDEPEQHTVLSVLPDYPNVVILKAFTKLYGMAGVRLGYCMSTDVELLECMRGAGQPWTVSTLAQAAGLAALREQEYVERLRTVLREERPRLHKGLEDLNLFVLPGEANFLLFRSEKALVGPLRRRGILLRSCADFRGLDETWYRVAVRTQADNTRLLDTLREVLF